MDGYSWLLKVREGDSVSIKVILLYNFGSHDNVSSKELFPRVQCKKENIPEFWPINGNFNCMKLF